jgi:tetratricopeptide (TPR) repeat protein
MQLDQVKPLLISILKDSKQSIDIFYQSLSEEERARPGSLKEWQAKDIVIHGTEWCKLLNQALLDIQQGNTPYLEEDYLAFNDRKYLETKDLPWKAALAEIGKVYKQALQIIKSLSPQNLIDPQYHPILKGQTVLSQLIGYYYTHPMYHLADYEYKNGRGEAAIDRLIKVVACIDQYDNSPHSRGASRYNVACFFCMADQFPQALDYLQQAFENAPELKTWAREDGDLQKLHQNEQFIALTEI